MAFPLALETTFFEFEKFSKKVWSKVTHKFFAAFFDEELHANQRQPRKLAAFSEILKQEMAQFFLIDNIFFQFFGAEFWQNYSTTALFRVQLFFDKNVAFFSNGN